jgi:carbonic anhydrase/acetyltransferase-like protein (isoleucine patch superfamily)
MPGVNAVMSACFAERGAVMREKPVKELIILGTGIHSMEMVEIIERINAAAPVWRLAGFLSPDSNGIGESRNGYPVLDGPEGMGRFPDACLVPDNEWPREIPLPWERVVSIADPSAFVSRTASIGKGCVIYPHGFIGANAVLGERVFMLAGCTVNHDDVIGGNTVLTSGVTLAGSVVVGNGCYMGQNCTVRQFLHIGEGSTVGMGSAVVRDVPPNAVMAGNPAKVLRMKE